MKNEIKLFEQGNFEFVLEIENSKEDLLSIQLREKEEGKGKIEDLIAILEKICKCERRGDCCRELEVEIKENEIDRIGKENIEMKKIDGKEKMYIKRNENNSCIFYNSFDRNCKIYENRPLACRLFYCNIYFKGSEIVKNYYHRE